MSTTVEKFKAEILKEVGVIPTSPILQHRVLIVRDEDNKVKVSAQVWWKDEEGIFNPGKGYFLTGRRALSIAKTLRRAISHTDLMDFHETMDLSNTQRYVITNKSDIETVFVDKWWRKGTDEEWLFGKSLPIPTQHVEELCSLLEKAGSAIIHTK